MIDLRSDTVTRPSDRMREAAKTADVGDDVYGEDPSVNALQDQAAELLGMDAALFCPSGTMANQVAVRALTNRGEEIIVERESHLYKWEVGGLAQNAALQTRPLNAPPRGVLTPEAVTNALVEPDDHRAGTGLVALENTHNSRGGRAIAPDDIEAAAAAAHAADVPVHLDGARLGNAAVAHDVPPAAFTREVDSVMLSLSKGLGAPVGSVVAGSHSFIDRAHRARKLYGGGMRQAGVIAAPAIHALDNLERLQTDHEHADRLANGLAAIPELDVVSPETNIVIVRTDDAGYTTDEFVDLLAAEDIAASPFGDHRVRFVTHRDVTQSDIDTAIERIDAVVP